MNTMRHTIETIRIAGLILVLTSLLMLVTGLDGASADEAAADADLTTEQIAPDFSAEEDAAEVTEPGGKPLSKAKEARMRRRAMREARRQQFVERIRSRREAAAQNATLQPATSLPVEPLAGINVSFKLDPRLTQSLYMGERWVSPPTYSGVQEGYYTLEARVQGRDIKGRPMQISPEWIPADPEMVTVSPSQGNQVQITVKRAGESSLKVVSEEVSKTLSIKATYPNNSAIQVEIIQKP